MLEEQKPIGTQPSPPPLAGQTLTQQKDENYYVARAALTRKTPFAPHSSDIVRNNPNQPKVVNAPPPPPPPPPPPEKKEPALTKKVWDATDLDIQVEYMGVMSLNGDTFALVKPKDGGEPRRLKVGDKIADFGYEVTSINKQEILMKDSENRPFVLKDTRFSADEEEDEDTFDLDDEKPAPKKIEPRKAEPKAPAPKKVEPKAEPKAVEKKAEPAKAAPKATNQQGTQAAGDQQKQRRPRPGAENRPKKIQ